MNLHFVAAYTPERDKIPPGNHGLCCYKEQMQELNRSLRGIRMINSFATRSPKPEPSHPIVAPSYPSAATGRVGTEGFKWICTQPYRSHRRLDQVLTDSKGYLQAPEHHCRASTDDGSANASAPGIRKERYLDPASIIPLFL